MHDDKNPSAAVFKDRWLRCFVCDKTVSGLDLLMEIRGYRLWDAAREAADVYGIVVPDWVSTPEQRRESAQQRAKNERDMVSAGYWRLTAIELAEETLASMRSYDGERFEVTSYLARLKRSNGTSLREFYRAERGRNRKFVLAMVEAGRIDEERIQVALAEFVAEYYSRTEVAA